VVWRRACIDFGVEIDFYTAEEAAKLFGTELTDLTVLSPEHMNNNHSRCAMAAWPPKRPAPGLSRYGGDPPVPPP
jgi:hypothetical protein